MHTTSSSKRLRGRKPLVLHWPITCVIAVLIVLFVAQEIYFLPDEIMPHDSSWRLRISDLLGASTAVILAFVITYSFSVRLRASSQTIRTAVDYLEKARNICYELLKMAREARDRPDGFESWHFANKLSDIELFIRLAQDTVDRAGWHGTTGIESVVALPFRIFSEALGEHDLLHNHENKRIHQSVQVEDAHAKMQIALNKIQHEITQP